MARRVAALELERLEVLVLLGLEAQLLAHGAVLARRARVLEDLVLRRLRPQALRGGGGAVVGFVLSFSHFIFERDDILRQPLALDGLVRHLLEGHGDWRAAAMAAPKSLARRASLRKR
jgi:hypothetical protein